MDPTGGAKRVVIAGGSGFLGTSLAQHLHDNGWSVTILSRQALYGRYVVPRRLLEDAHFEFRFPMLADALKDLL